MQDRAEMGEGQRIETSGKNAKAPRVTLEGINAKIKHLEYVKHVSITGQVLRWAIITMENGFAVAGKPSAAVCPENDDEEYGKEIAYEHAFDEVWKLEGYLLRERLKSGEGDGFEAKVSRLYVTERSLLGSILLNDKHAGDVLGILKADELTDPRHRAIYRAMSDLHARHEKIDLITVTENLRDKGILVHNGGAAYLAGLTSSTFISASVASQAIVIREATIARMMMAEGQ